MKKCISILLAISVVWIFASCNNRAPHDPADLLIFSTDTVQFDTIFTGIGSTTKCLSIKNANSSKALNIDRIYVAKGSSSKYRLNIDGRATNNYQNYKLAPGDSLFIFVEVTIDPNRDEMIEQDSIIFQVNDKQQDVKLIAFGQDVTLLNGHMISNDTTWTPEKPVLIYNSAMVDNDITLTILPGTKVYLHNNSSLFIKGTLKANGEIGNRIIITGDRLEDGYSTIQGQWGAYLQDEIGNTTGIYGGLHFAVGSKNNILNNTDITNALIGVQVDSCVTPNIPTLKMKNSNIENSKIAGLYALGAYVEAENCVFANSGKYTVACWIGGRYIFKHCTMANYSSGVRQTPELSLKNYYTYTTESGATAIEYRDITEAKFENCIIYGLLKNEIEFDLVAGAEANLLFNNCLIKYQDCRELTGTSFVDNIYNEDPLFYSLDKPYSYKLSITSSAIDKAKVSISENIPLDHDGVNRISTDGKPDIGAYEFFEEDESNKSLRRK